ncbi:hypothetical protein M407DRAFT_23367 [Tulasnella calospora MUT 4182]|uniref:Uncharacterized protein n=1 Tax=Tulasnella calospora MUT 4182 TaxID=1051891 RepID=A0A0C3L158_9AGAM|nr:hypothetical protein M407DRAFT_23367 [Tulasnella calospora MUT 4182]
MRSGSTPLDSQPPPKPPAIPGRLPRTPPGDAPKPSLEARVESLKKELALIVKNTEWPAESADAAKGLHNTISSSPNISHNMAQMTQELQNLVERYIQTLDDVCIRLKDASSKPEMKRWKFLQRIKSLTSNRPSKCTLLLQTCQDDVSKAINAFKDHERAKGKCNLYVFANMPVSQQQSSQFVAQELSTGTAEHGLTSEHSTSSLLVAQQPLSNTPKDPKNRSAISDKALTIARKTFKTVEIGSGAIPVVGSFVGATAKVGLAFVEMLQTMDRNHSLAVDLGNHTSKLTKLLENFKGKSSSDEQDIAAQIQDLHEELGRVQKKVEEWSTSGQFGKAFSARDHSGLLVSIDSRNIIVELENNELRKERRRLLNCLGDGQYGGRGDTIEDIVCFPGTRLEILKEIDEWIRDESSPNPVLWISGMAGRGKSTIASTVVHNWKCRASCAIFHFRRGQSALNSRMICALARQLGGSLVSEVKNAVLESVRENEGIAEPGRRLDEQFETLFVAAFAKLKNHRHPILIVVDALDECNNVKGAVDFIRLIHKHSPSFPANTKFLLTCRPEDLIRCHLESKKWRKQDLDSAAEINSDLARFIQDACTQIRDDRDLSEDWPAPGDIEQLVQMSQGLFQWARTVVTYIGIGSPVDRLRGLLRRPSKWSGLDDLYHQIFSKAFDSVRLDDVRQDILHRVLGTLVVAPHPVSLDVIATLYSTHEMFDGTENDRIIPYLRKDVLADLTSLLFIPESPAQPMRLMHTSIQDLLASELRCKSQPFYVDPTRCHQQLANICLKIMLDGLVENVCNLSDVSKPGSEVQDIVESEISKGVQYCCRAWPTHLTQGVRWPRPDESATTGELAHFQSFSKEKLMCWLEVMSLLGATTDAIVAAKDVCQWLLERSTDVVPQHDPLTALWEDVRRFITTFLEPISFGPLHIYISALPHCPTGTEIWDLYGKRARVRLLHGHQASTWPSNLWTRSQNADVFTVAFSPDGRVLAVGLADNTVQLLDTQTGTAVGEPLTGHSDYVSSVCFSPDGKLLVSGSDDKTIRLWDPQAGELVGEPITGHNGQVWSVCFSPDGRLLASGSKDDTVRLWDTKSRALVREPLTGHGGGVNSVCFSPNGEVLASGSDDNTVRFWNTQTGAALGKPLAGHSARVWSVCLSPDGKLLASASVDKTIRLWNTETRTLVGEPLTGHSNQVQSVCFSPDGKVLASGSNDGTVRLWDTQSGAAFGEPLTGHSSTVWSVRFSPDGKLLASGSADETVRLWDPRAGAAVTESVITQRAMVNSVCFSSDGKRLASVSSDHIIQLWDPQTGAAVGEPLTGHSGKVNSVCFSPDGKLLASGSDDRTIRIWDTQTGVALGQPLRGNRDYFKSVDFSPDGKLLASGSDEKTIQIWDNQTWTAVGEPFTGHGDWVRSVCFSPDGNLLASGSDDQTIRLWDPVTRVAVGEPLEGHSGYVLSVSFSSDGMLLMAQCSDGSAATWDITTRQRCDTPRSLSSFRNPVIRDHWVTVYSSRFFWLPSQYWNTGRDGVALSQFGGALATLQNGSLSIFDVSHVLGS